MIYREHLTIETRGRGTYELTRALQQTVERSGIDQGLCHVFIHHTSASLIVCENADPTVRRDLEQFAANLVPDGDPSFQHDSEGPDDMPAHIRSILTLTSLTIPVERAGATSEPGRASFSGNTAPARIVDASPSASPATTMRTHAYGDACSACMHN